MLRTTLAGLRLHKSRYVTTVLAILLGVMFVSGTMVFADTLEAGYEKTVMGSAASVDAVAVPSEPDSGGSEEPEEALLTTEQLDEVRALPEVAGADGVVNGEAVLLDADGRAFGFVPPVAVSFGEHTRFSAEEGTLPGNGGEIALAASTAEQIGFAVGDRVTVLDREQAKREFTLTGLVEFGTEQDYSFRGAVVFDEDTLREMAAVEGYVEIDATAAPGHTDQQVSDAVAAALGSSAEVMTGDEFGVKLAEGTGADTLMLRTVLLLFSFIAMFVAGIVIHNTFAILIAQRQREMALLRCVGAKRSQVFRSVLLESLAVGLLSSALGVLAGVGVGYAGAAFGGPLLGMEGASAVVVSPTAMVLGMSVGTVVTVFSALVPAMRATRVPPLAALRTSATAAGLEKGTGRVRAVFGALCFLASAALVALTRMSGPSETNLVIVTAAALVAFTGVVVLGPLLVRGIVRVLGIPLRRTGVPSMLAVDNSVRSPRRAAAAMIALTVGATLITGYSVVSASTEKTLTAQLEEQFPIDYQITPQMFLGEPAAAEPEETSAEDAPEEETASEEEAPPEEEAAAADGTVGAPDVPAVPAEVVRALREDPLLERVMGQRSAAVESDNGTLWVNTHTSTRFGEDMTADTVEGDISDMGPGKVVLQGASADGFSVGDTFTLPLDDGGELSLEVAAITEEGQMLYGVTLHEDDFARAFPEITSDEYVYVRAVPGADPADVREAVHDAVEDHPTLQVMSVSEVKEQLSSILDIAFYTIAAMLALAIVIAVFGISNTMALSVLERTRESALLRALGLAKGQLRRMLGIEAVLLCLIGAGIGIVFGVVFGWAAGAAVLPGLEFTVPYAQIAVFIALAVLAGLAAAVLPARRAAGTSITGALAGE